MKTNIVKRSISLLLALILCVSSFAGLGTTAFAAVGEKADVYIVEFPAQEKRILTAGVTMLCSI